MAIIAVDFDGTVVTHEYPEIGRDIGAVPVLKALVEQGHLLILWTMRDKNTLEDAVNWFYQNDIPLYGANKNPEQHWSDSPKCYAHIYLDDAALGAPVVQNDPERPYINWDKMRILLTKRGFLK